MLERSCSASTAARWRLLPNAGVARLPATAGARPSAPGRDRLRREPHGQAAARPQAGLVGRPVRHPVPLLRDAVPAVLVRFERQARRPWSVTGRRPIPVLPRPGPKPDPCTKVPRRRDPAPVVGQGRRAHHAGTARLVLARRLACRRPARAGPPAAPTRGLVPQGGTDLRRGPRRGLPVALGRGGAFPDLAARQRPRGSAARRTGAHDRPRRPRGVRATVEVKDSAGAGALCDTWSTGAGPGRGAAVRAGRGLPSRPPSVRAPRAAPLPRPPNRRARAGETGAGWGTMRCRPGRAASASRRRSG